MHTHLVCNVPPCKWTLELSVGLIFCSITKVYFLLASWICRLNVMALTGLIYSTVITVTCTMKSNINNKSTSMPLWSLLCIKWGLSLVWGSFELLNLSLVKMRCLFLGRNDVYLKINLKRKRATICAVYYKWDTKQNFLLKLCTCKHFAI